MKFRTGIQAVCLLLLSLFSFNLKAQVSADFTASPDSGCAPLIVSFKDVSTGSPTQWKWDLGNGTISFLQNPSASYFNPGLYTIKLVASNGTTTDSIIKTQYISVSSKPNVEFNASTTSGCYPLPVQFTDQSTAGSGAVTNWQWDFGDGLSSNDQNPLHTYTASGNYNVTLRVTNSAGCLTTISKSQYIQISAGVTANFSNSVPNVCSAPVTINFQNNSTGTGSLTYQWLFGDGASSTALNPSHSYTNAGSYSVQLVVTNSTGCTDTIIHSNGVTVGNVSASFNMLASTCGNIFTVFENTSSPQPVSAFWNFGDGTTSTQLSPVKKYTVPGSYTVKMFVNFGSCTDSSIKTITVLPSPKAAFIADDSTNCGSPFTVNFINESIGAVQYSWDFGDTTTSILANPQHTYTRIGNFNVTLVVTSTNGCTDTLKKTNYIKIVPPKATLKNLPDSGCAPFTKSFSSSIATVDPIVGYFWDFGDGNTSVFVAPTHTYLIPGAYTVKLIITTVGGCVDSTVKTNAVFVNSKPQAIFSATPRDACAKEGVTFNDESLGAPIKWLWDFGDGSKATSQFPTHKYTDTGYFDIQLIIWNTGCSDTIKYLNYIHVKPPIARYVITFNCNKPFERVFTDQSIGADSWLWDFGDGTTSIQKSPVHTYSTDGSYIVNLTVYNNSTGCDYENRRTIQVIDVKPSFFASDTVICKGSKVDFTTNLSKADINSFKWNFGDGTLVDSVTNTASHIYKIAGTYSVSLVTTNILGCKDTLTKSMYIRVDGPTAKFASSVPGSCLNSTVLFNDQSVSDGTHAIQTWNWNYADGINETLTAAPFQHNYAAPGNYKVGLTVIDTRGCSDSIKLATALIISKPVASFKTTDTATCPGKPVNFTNLSTGPGLNYFWNFGDGTTSTLKSPAHTFTIDGNYDVALKITDQYGCADSMLKSGYVNIVTSVADFNMSDSFSTCPPLIVQFTNLSTNAISQVWDFGDGSTATVKDPSHFYSYPGNYTVTLSVKGPGGCIEVKKKNILINGPTGTFTYSPLKGCNPVTVNFSATTKDRLSFIWDFSNGATSVTADSVISYTYLNQGTYVPKMILIDPNGCQVPVTGKDTIQVSGVIAKFNFTDKTLCDAGSISFADSSLSNDLITGYNWTFGDGTSATTKNPVHPYGATGLFYPKLIITTSNGCKDSVLSAKPVKIVASPKADMTKTKDGCTPVKVTFSGLLTAADTSAVSWYWNFGNGNTSTIKNPPVQDFTVSGIYDVNLMVTNSSGCVDTVIKPVNAYVIPSVNAGPDTVICKGVGITLQTTGASTYSWTPSKGLSCVNCANPVATPDSVTNYIVKGASVQGCSASDTVKVKVRYPFKIAYSKPDTLCKGQDKKLFAVGADVYEWSPPLGLNDNSLASPTARPDSTITYKVVGTDIQGCFKDSGYVPLKVYPIPTVDAGPDQTINVGKTTDLTPTFSSDVISVIWTPTGAIFRNNYPNISIKPTTNTVYTVEVKNRGGCLARDQVSVFVLCNGANVFIPNTFSPNGDGANDIFYPRGTGLFKIKNLKIFNRWGEVVFEKSSFNANDPSSGWDGTYKGVKLPSDVFVYMIDIICDNNSILPYRGNIALMR
ncbi:MAG: PKD domain-containing protein [Ferruginibacter sp.]